ncbi:MAG: Exonuclease RNase and polymerase [Thermomicrobiales bacterium]|nr:Exonuclease RNase and polymerase [Thermomicrobiales bacterium]
MSLPFVALALTTTGPDPRRDRVSAVQTVTVDVGGERTRFNATVRSKSIGTEYPNPATPPPEDQPQLVEWPEIAAQLRALLANRRVVTHDADRSLAVLAAEGVRLEQAPLDTAELASILVPGLASTDLDTLGEALDVTPAGNGPPRNAADALADVFEALLAKIAAYDDVTLERLATHISDGGWQFADLFEPRTAARFRSTREPRLMPAEIAYLRERAREEALEPTGSLEPLDRQFVQDVIGPRGTLSEVIVGFERRRQQEQMADAVAEAINISGQILVEAGTGTGKSLAYLVPAALSATERGETVVLSTNTLALQDQLLRKDVPDLIAALSKADGDRQVGVVALKGRANYLCLRKWFPWERQVSLEPNEARLKAKILAWLPQTTTGDRAELRLTGGEEIFWRQVAEEEGACDPGSCVFHQRGQCFLFRARRAAESAHLVVVNHALLLTDAASSNRILPDYDALVVDEAHHLEDQATAQFTVTLSERNLTEYAEAVASNDGAAMSGVAAGAVAFLMGAVADDAGQRRARLAREHLDTALAASGSIRAAGRDLFTALEYIHVEAGGAGGGSERAYRVTAATRTSPAWQAVDEAWDRLLEGLRSAESTLRWYASAVDEVDDVAIADLAEAGERQELLLSDLANTIRIGIELAGKFASALDSPEAGRVFWLDRQGATDRITFRSAPLDVSGLLQERLFKKTRAAILTSATLAVDGDCNYLASRLGIPDASSLIVPSPFDYRASVLLYLTDDTPEPTHPDYRDVLERTLVDVIDATRGRALVLFTSHALLSDMARSITGPLQDRGIAVLAQRRDGSPQQLTERLRRETNVAVLGTASFWEGVDVSGEALSLLAITRLPFTVPTDPVFAARSEAFEDAFAGYAVPQAVLRFKQGFGRLIRSSRDRGVCAVLDRRILTKRYGATFLQSLPECSVEVGSVFDLPGSAMNWLEAAPKTQSIDRRSSDTA